MGLLTNLPPRCVQRIRIAPISQKTFIVLCPRSAQPGTVFCPAHQPEEHHGN